MTFRHFGGEEDFAGMVDVLNAAAKHDGVDRYDTVEELANSYHHLTNCDLNTDLLIAEGQGEVVGYCRVMWWVEEATRHRILAFVFWVTPAVRALGVERAMASWGEQRLRDIASAQPVGSTQLIESWAEDSEASKQAVLAAAGLEVTQTHARMTRSLGNPIPDHRLPKGLEIRPVTDADMRRLWEADQEAFRDHVGYSEQTENDFLRFTNDPNQDPSLYRVAFDGDDIAGQVLNYLVPDEIEETGRKRGWTEAISTQRSWRGKGVAKALITDSMRMFKDMGMDEVSLEVHTTNPTGAYALYEGLGYEVVSKSFEYRKPF